MLQIFCIIFVIADEAHGWLGWSNKKKPLVMEFEFNSLQEFESVTLSAYCQLDLGIQPLSQMLAYFKASENHTYHQQYLKSVNNGQVLDKEPQDITFGLDSRIGNSPHNKLVIKQILMLWFLLHCRKICQIGAVF